METIEIAISAASAIWTETAILVISMETTEFCYFRVTRTMPRPGMCAIIDISCANIEILRNYPVGDFGVHSTLK